MQAATSQYNSLQGCFLYSLKSSVLNSKESSLVLFHSPKTTMGANNRHRKSSSFTSVFNIFKSNRQRGGGGGGGGYRYDAYRDEGTRARKVWTSDEDRGRWGVAEPGIDTKAADFIAQYKKKVTESEIHCQAQPK